ncbi:hypothetical protein [Absidia glauca]|uniref:DH domain-containing protein n=1 Tax=Absidia glauca TaxID=4829 RepID=A0A168RP45_ABSGL|nr:hypothetical protein [Absidia glauca]
MLNVEKVKKTKNQNTINYHLARLSNIRNNNTQLDIPSITLLRALHSPGASLHLTLLNDRYPALSTPSYLSTPTPINLPIETGNNNLMIIFLPCKATHVLTPINGSLLWLVLGIWADRSYYVGYMTRDPPPSFSSVQDINDNNRLVKRNRLVRKPFSSTPPSRMASLTTIATSSSPADSSRLALSTSYSSTLPIAHTSITTTNDCTSPDHGQATTPRDISIHHTGDLVVSPNDSIHLLSNLSQLFISGVKLVVVSRKLFCTDEYPLSFTGIEAMDIVRRLVPGNDKKDKVYRNIARSLMALGPPLFEPLPYSEKSLKKNKFYDTANEFYALKDSPLELPQGVYPLLSQCYSPRCALGDGVYKCYSPSCPNRGGTKNERLMAPTSSPSSPLNSIPRAKSLVSSLASSHDSTSSRAWSAMIPRDILKTTPESEIKRQEAIHELIYTEEDYVRDLNLLDDLFAKPLATAQCIEPDRRLGFCEAIFANYLAILALHRALYKDLRDYQGSCQAQGDGFVGRVGDIFLRHVSGFEAAYLKYGPNVVLADYKVKMETSSNILFQNFVREKEKQAETRKLPFRHFMVLPVTRIQRYSLLLDAVIKKTPDDHKDKKDLALVISSIVRVATLMDQQTAISKQQLRILQIHDQIHFKATTPDDYPQDEQRQQQEQQRLQLQEWTVHDLKLLVPDRRLIYEGTVTRRSQSTLHLLLFDHMLILTKPTRKNDKQATSRSPPGGPSATFDPSVEYSAYRVYKYPIPLSFLHIRGTEGFALRNYTLARSAQEPTSPIISDKTPSLPPSSPILPMRFNLTNASSPTPLTLQHIGRYGGEYSVYMDSPAQQLEWKEKIVEAKAQWERNHLARQVLEIRCLTDHTFGPSLSAGKISASVLFVSTTGRRMVASSTSRGLWIGSADGSIPHQQVLVLANVTQIDIMHENHILLVLADKTLTAYALELLDPSTTKKGCSLQKVSQNVQFFSCGKSMGRSLLVTMKRKGMDSHFKAYEPCCGDLRDSKNHKFLNNKTGFLGKTQSWFKLYKPFYIGAAATGIQLLKARLAIVCERGFEIIDLDALDSIRILPDVVNDKDFDFLATPDGILAKPLAMFKRQADGFLLCYDSFFFLVNYKGAYDRSCYEKVEWISSPQSVAFYHPYIIAFDPQMIEIRHVETGKLVQVLAGNDLQCLSTSPSLQGVMTHPYDANYQYVFELLPRSL